MIYHDYNHENTSRHLQWPPAETPLEVETSFNVKKIEVLLPSPRGEVRCAHIFLTWKKQGLVNVPWLGNIKDITWKSSHKKDHIPNGWVMWNMGTFNDLLDWPLERALGRLWPPELAVGADTGPAADGMSTGSEMMVDAEAADGSATEAPSPEPPATERTVTLSDETLDLDSRSSNPTEVPEEGWKDDGKSVCMLGSSWDWLWCMCWCCLSNIEAVACPWKTMES